MNATHRLPLGVLPGTDESIASLIDRTAHRNGIARNTWLGLLGVLPTNPMRTLTPPHAEAIANLTGLSTRTIRTMLPSRYPELVTGSFETGGKTRHRGPGLVILEPARVCDECLVEEPGVIRVTWMLGTSVLCSTHRRVLAPTCRHCRPMPGFLSIAKHARVPHRDCTAVTGEKSLSDLLPVPPPADETDLARQELLDEWVANSRDDERAADRLISLARELALSAQRGRTGTPESALEAWGWEVDARWREVARAGGSASQLSAHVGRTQRPAMDPAVTLAHLPRALAKVLKHAPTVTRWTAPLRTRISCAAADAVTLLGREGFTIRNLPARVDVGSVVAPTLRPWKVRTALALMLGWTLDGGTLATACSAMGLTNADHALAAVVLQLPANEHEAVPRALMSAAESLIEVGLIDYAGRRDALWGLTHVEPRVWASGPTLVHPDDARTAAAVAWARATGGSPRRSPAHAHLRTDIDPDNLVDDFTERHGPDTLALLDMYVAQVVDDAQRVPAVDVVTRPIRAVG